MPPGRPLRGLWLGRRPYGPVLDLQERLHADVAAGRCPDTVLLLEHTPVVTLGRGANPAHVLLGEDTLRERGWECVRTSRGGDVTLHAPGQLVGYPIIDLKPDRCDVRRYVQDLTEAMRRLALGFGVHAGGAPGLIGLWADRAAPGAWRGAEHATDLAKLGAIGVKISRWVTQHGFALNLTTAPDLFRMIVPCGIRDHGVTSVAELMGGASSPREAAGPALSALADVLHRRNLPIEDCSETDLDALGWTEPGRTRTTRGVGLV